MRCGVNWQEVFKHPFHMLHRYLYYCPTTINTEIKGVIFNFSLCKLRECKLRSGVNLQEMFKPKRHKTRPGYIYIYNQLLSIEPTNRLSSMSPVVPLLKLMFHPLKGHYQAVKTFINRSIHSLIQLCIYRVKLYDNTDVRHKKCTSYTLAKLQIFKIDTHS